MNTKKSVSGTKQILLLLVLTFGSFLLAQLVVGLIFMLPLSSAGLDSTTAFTIGGIVGSLLVLALWYKINSATYRFMPTNSELTGSFFLLSPFVVYWILLFGSYGILAGSVPFVRIDRTLIMISIMAGMSEEIVFREIAISYMTKIWRSEKVITVIALLSGLLFGITHLSNSMAKGDVEGTVYQTVLCIMTGIFFGAIYLRKGNVWVLMLVHVIHDILAMSAAEGVGRAGITDLPLWTEIFILVIEASLALYGLYLIRPSKREEILKFWDYKWSRE